MGRVGEMAIRSSIQNKDGLDTGRQPTAKYRQHVKDEYDSEDLRGDAGEFYGCVRGFERW